MPDKPPIGGVFRRPFAEQVAYFRGKLGKLVPTTRWDDIEREAHDTAFMVAGAQKADLLADLAAAVDRATAEGKSLEAFRKDFDAAVDRHDWHGWTGEDTKGGRAWRTRTIYRTNTSVSYAAGRLAQLKEGNFKYWVYRHGGSVEPRPEHLSWDGVALPPDHPFWETHYPPSDWGCSCYVVGARTAAGVRRLGGDPDKKLPDNWRDLDPRTGAPVGIGKGWDYAPGATVAGNIRAIAGKIGSWDYQIAKAFMSDLPPELRDEMAEAYRHLPSVGDDLRRFAASTLETRADQYQGRAPVEVKTIGALTEADIQAVRKATGRDTDGYDFTIARSDIGHIDARHGSGETTPGQVPVAPEHYALLPKILNDTTPVLDGTSDIGEPLMRYEQVIRGLRYVAIFAVRGKKRRTLGLKTFFIQTGRKVRGESPSATS